MAAVGCEIHRPRDGNTCSSTLAAYVTDGHNDDCNFDGKGLSLSEPVDQIDWSARRILRAVGPASFCSLEVRSTKTKCAGSRDCSRGRLGRTPAGEDPMPVVGALHTRAQADYGLHSRQPGYLMAPIERGDAPWKNLN